MWLFFDAFYMGEELDLWNFIKQANFPAGLNISRNDHQTPLFLLNCFVDLPNISC